jgi:hypothetical protein
MSAYQELKGHRDLKVYQLAYKLAMEIFEVSKKLPVKEKYPLQIKSAVLREVLLLTSQKGFGNVSILKCS